MGDNSASVCEASVIVTVTTSHACYNQDAGVNESHRFARHDIKQWRKIRKIDYVNVLGQKILLSN